ncbi:MAG: 5'-nucleotidase C-terminal domain-containing protein [Desulfomicrobium escambiense]|nr:5'-nucleotidase C-terminal domain-containing protein [Desulfomicrobium escambiense]
MPATLVRQAGGVKVGFIGITSDIVAMMHPMMAVGMAFTQGEDNYRQLINEHARAVRAQGASVVVVMSGLGIHKDHRLAQIVESGAVDVFFSAHTHEATFTPLRSASGALVVEAGNDGYLGRMDITVRNGRVTARDWVLLPVTPDIPEDRKVRQLVAEARAPFLRADVDLEVPMPMSDQRLRQPINTVVGHAPHALDRRNALESSFNNAFTDALRRVAGTEVAMSPGFRFDAVTPEVATELDGEMVGAGAVTLEDVYRFFPVAYTLAVAETDAGHLREVLESSLTHVFSTDVFRQGGGWMEGLSGLELDLDMNRPDGERVRALRLSGGRTPVPDLRITIAGCSRPMDASDELCSHGGFRNVKPLINRATGRAWTPIDLLVESLRKDLIPDRARHDLHAEHAATVWPTGGFVQPLTGN